ncbi:MAG TPA: primosomal protein N' [Thermodesulfovibrionales bacterium]|nr:primosomal protein N' [Thermodesulfovibrionales bacterium]
MEYFDVVFPLNIGPLTYRCGTSMASTLTPGMLVSAPLKRRLAKGIVLGRSPAVPTGDIKDLHGIICDAPLLTVSMLTLMNWMSDYYMAERGLVLKTMLPAEIFNKPRPRRGVASSAHCESSADYQLKQLDPPDTAAAGFIKSMSEGGYRTTLLYAPSSDYEHSFLATVLRDIRNVIILAPEVTLAEGLFPAFTRRFGDRVSLFHNELSRGTRSEVLSRISSGRSDIVLGTRSTVFTLMKKVSMIAVLNEHSSCYKEEKTPYYNARDVAVMRGFIEKIPVLLSSPCPSMESVHNCEKGKYNLITPQAPVGRPKVKIVDMRYERKSRPYLAKTIVDKAERYIRSHSRISFVINRRGYSTMLRCDDCDHVEECPSCRIPLIFHKKELSLKCHYCGYTISPPARCTRCKGHNIRMTGAGTQRIQEDLEELLGTGTVRIDSDITAKKSALKKALTDALGLDSRIVVGTKLMSKRLALSKGFSMAAVLNPDILLNVPDFRAPEKAYQEITSVAGTIKNDGELFIQTRMPQHYLYQHLRRYDYLSFVKEENKRRLELDYPPYSRLMLIRCISEKNLSKELSGICEKVPEDVRVLGPQASITTSGKNEFRILLKSSVRGSLHAAAGRFIAAFTNIKDVKIRVDVDPVTI